MLNLDYKLQGKYILGDMGALFFRDLYKIRKVLLTKTRYMKFRKEFEKIINSLQIEKLNEKSLRKIKKRLDYLDNYINKQEYSTCKMLESPVSEIFFNPIFEKEDFFIN